MNTRKPSSTNPIITYSLLSFQSSCELQTGYSDFHKMAITVIKMAFQKLKLKITNYRNYSMFFDIKKNCCPEYQW